MLGELSYLSKSPGTGGSLKNAPEDFVVEEICADGSVLELGKPVQRAAGPGPFTHFVLQKRNWSTPSALSEIAGRLRASPARFSVSGMKDRAAITVQLASVQGVQPEALLALGIRDIAVLGAWPAKERVRMGQHLGNRFTIRAAGLPLDAALAVDKISAELGGRIPNYFGGQRFGSSRQNTHLIGALLLRGKEEGAARMFLCGPGGEENAEAAAARKELEATGDYAAALKSFPRHLRLERAMLAHLARSPSDHAGAFRRLPRNIALLFIHAFQSHMFNLLLSARLREGGPELEEGEYFCGEAMGFPDLGRAEAEGWIAAKVIGYQTVPNGREKTLLEGLGVDKESFRMKSLPELASKGTRRALLAPLKDFNFSGDKFTFSLPSGSYATVAMREFMDAEKGAWQESG